MRMASLGQAWTQAGASPRRAGRGKVAFADNAQPLRKLGNLVGAFQDAVAASDALVVRWRTIPVCGSLVVSQDGTSVEAGGIGAMMTGGGDRLLERITRLKCAPPNRLSGWGSGPAGTSCSPTETPRVARFPRPPIRSASGRRSRIPRIPNSDRGRPRRRIVRRARAR